MGPPEAAYAVKNYFTNCHTIIPSHFKRKGDASTGGNVEQFNKELADLGVEGKTVIDPIEYQSGKPLLEYPEGEAPKEQPKQAAGPPRWGDMTWEMSKGTKIGALPGLEKGWTGQGVWGLEEEGAKPEAQANDVEKEEEKDGDANAGDEYQDADYGTQD